MAEPISIEKVGFQLVADDEKATAAPDPETPFRILVMGSFSGWSGEQLSIKKPMIVDRDNFDAVMERLEVSCELDLSGDKSSSLIIHFNELDDFHPDQLFDRLKIFQELRNLRRKLNDPKTFEEAAGKLKAQNRNEEPPPAPPRQPDPTPPVPPSSGSLLDDIVAETEGKPPAESVGAKTGTGGRGDGFEGFLREIVQPYIVPDTEDQQAELVGSVDEAISSLMQMILHHPDFQALESAWRGLAFLTYRLETDENLKLYILDAGIEEVTGDLAATENMAETAMYKVLVEQTVGTPGADPWAVVIGNYTFEPTVNDGALLNRISLIARAAGAPFIAAAGDRLAECESLAATPDPDNWRYATDEDASAAWEQLKQLPETHYLGLVLPRFLLRLPYGEDTDPVDRFDFEEMENNPVHEDYLWGNSAFPCALLLGQAFTQDGWQMRPGSIQEIEKLPLHMYKKDGETIIKPCAEIMLSQKAAERLLEKGLMALLSFQHQDKVRLARFQSLSDTALAGPWG